ncbi:MAG TPA: SIMPL domain-containing protein [Candidatus Limnocylindrales bacterium]
MNDQASNPTPQHSTGTSRIGPITIGRAIAVTAAASLLVGLILGPIISGRATLAADPTTPPEHTVTVSSNGVVSVAPDVADVVIGVMAQKVTVAEAQTAAATSMTSVIAAVKKTGVDAKDIVTVNISLNPVYDYNTNGAAPRLVGYQFANTIKVTVRDISKVAAVVDDSMAAGATTVNGITFRVGDPKAAQGQARGLAMTDARAKADALAAAAGVSVKGVANITETSSQPTPIYYAAGTLDAAKAQSVSTPIQTGTTDITIQVTVTYLIG